MSGPLVTGTVLKQRSCNWQLVAIIAFKDTKINCQSGKMTKLGSGNTNLSPNKLFNNQSLEFQDLCKTIKNLWILLSVLGQNPIIFFTCFLKNYFRQTLSLIVLLPFFHKKQWEFPNLQLYPYSCNLYTEWSRKPQVCCL